MAMLGEDIRRYGFWLVDALGGGQVRERLLELEKNKLEGKPETSSDDLRKLLNHAVNTTGFYAKYKGFLSITDFPVIKKSVVKEKYDQFISAEYKNRRLHKMSTSGSTGQRFVMLQDIQKRKRVLAEIIYFNRQCGFRLGYRYVYVRVWHRDNKKSKLVQLAENMLMYDCASLSDEMLHQFYQLLRKDKTIRCLAGYAASLSAIAFYFDRQGYTPDLFNIEVIVCGAERLEPRAKATLQKVFGCTVVSRYSNQENGMLGQQPVDGDDFTLNTAHYFFETLKLDADEPAPLGEPSRLVLTDLYNYAMPLIRYNTEDIVIMQRAGNGFPEKKVLSEISGRNADIIYDTRGNKISPHYFAVQLRCYEHLPLYQFTQETLKDFTLKMEGSNRFYEDKDITRTISNLVGRDAAIKIEYVDKIPHLSSGKFRTIICNYKAGTD